MADGPAKILVVAFDAGDKDILLEGARVGRFPALRSLLDRAVWGTVANPTGLYVGAVWPSFYTGTSPARHGRYCFRQLRAGTYEVHRVRPDEVRADPFWRRLSAAGRRVAIVDVPKTRPEEGLNGLQVVDWATHDPDYEGALTWPPALLGEIESSVGPRLARVCDAYLRGPGLGALRPSSASSRVATRATAAGITVRPASSRPADRTSARSVCRAPCRSWTSHRPFADCSASSRRTWMASRSRSWASRGARGEARGARGEKRASGLSEGTKTGGQRADAHESTKERKHDTDSRHAYSCFRTFVISLISFESGVFHPLVASVRSWRLRGEPFCQIKASVLSRKFVDILDERTRVPPF